MRERIASRTRLDLALVERGVVSTRSRAQEAIVSGLVRVNGEVCVKPSTKVDGSDRIDCAGVNPFVGRGGLKLSAALDAFRVDPAGLRCLDVGASTGGFTDCLLQRRAAHVTAIDVGSGQMAPALTMDPRVTLREGLNARYILPSDVDGPFDLAVIDVSFISLTLLFSPVVGLLRLGAGRIIVLIKPQFEVGRAGLGAGGIVRDEKLRTRAVESVIESAGRSGLSCLGQVDSPILGGDGNKEFLAIFACSTPAEQHVS